MDNQEKLKHMEMIQMVINRLANNSFLVKGWTITISLAGFGLFVSKAQSVFLTLILFAVLIFWVLDAYYLRRERLFRKLYESLADSPKKPQKNIKPLSMDISKFESDVASILIVMFSFPTVLVYLGIIVMTVTLYLGIIQK